MPEFYRLGMTKEEINDTLQTAVREPQPVVAGNFAAFTKDGQIIDSEKSAADFAPAPLDRKLTLYVNADTGSDNNDGLTAERPKKTIMAAINSIPKDLSTKDVTVNAFGHFAEKLALYGFFNGVITILGNDDTSITNGIVITYCTAYIWLKNLNVSGNVYGDVIDVSYSACATIDRCNIDATGATQRIGVMASACPALSIIFGTIDNAAVACMSRLSVVDAYNVSGNANDVGYQAGNLNTATAGFVFVYNSKIAASVETKKEAGGVIFKDGAIV